MDNSPANTNGQRDANTQELKKKLIQALHNSLGVVTAACEKLGISRQTFYNYLAEDKDFAQAVADVGEVALDFTESKMFRRIEKGDNKMIQFFLETKGKKRGYVKRSEIDLAQIAFNVDIKPPDPAKNTTIKIEPIKPNGTNGHNPEEKGEV